MYRQRFSKVLQRALPNMLVVLFGVFLYVFLTQMPAFRNFFGKIIGYISPFIWAFAIAYILSAPLNWLEKHWYKNIKKRSLRRVVSVLTVYLMLIGIVVLIFAILIPQLAISFKTLIDNGSAGYANAEKLLTDLLEQFDFSLTQISPIFESWDSFTKWLVEFVTGLVPQIVGISMSIGSFVLNMLVSLIASIYLLFSKERFIAQIKRATYSLFRSKNADRIVEVATLSHRTFGGFLVGKIADSLIIGVLCFFGCTILRIPYAPLVSVIIGVTNIIPFFGPFIGAIPSLFIILIDSPVKCLWFGIFIIVLQQFDGNILGPKILGQSTGLNAFWVMVAIVVGGAAFGVMGMIIGVPTFSVIYTLSKMYIDNRLKRKGMPTAPNYYMSHGPVSVRAGDGDRGEDVNPPPEPDDLMQGKDG